MSDDWISKLLFNYNINCQAVPHFILILIQIRVRMPERPNSDLLSILKGMQMHPFLSGRKTVANVAAQYRSMVTLMQHTRNIDRNLFDESSSTWDACWDRKLIFRSTFCRISAQIFLFLPWATLQKLQQFRSGNRVRGIQTPCILNYTTLFFGISRMYDWSQ